MTKDERSQIMKLIENDEIYLGADGVYHIRYTPAGEPASHNDPKPPHDDAIFYIALVVITFVAIVWFICSGGVMPR